MAASLPGAVTAQAPAFAAEDGVPVWQSSVLNSANGVYVGPDGNVPARPAWPAARSSSSYPESGEVIDRIGAERGVAGPDDVFVTDDGTIYWTEILGGNVGMLRPDGTFTTQQVGPGVNPITLSDDGRLFVARVFIGDGLYELDPEPVGSAASRHRRPRRHERLGLRSGRACSRPLQFGGGAVRGDVDAERRPPRWSSKVCAYHFGSSMPGPAPRRRPR